MEHNAVANKSISLLCQDNIKALFCITCGNSFNTSCKTFQSVIYNAINK